MRRSHPPTSSACAATRASIGRRANGVNNPIGSLEPVSQNCSDSEAIERIGLTGRNRPVAGKKGKGRRTVLVLLVMGRDDRLLLQYLNRSAAPSDIDTSTWRNRASLRVRHPNALIRFVGSADHFKGRSFSTRPSPHGADTDQSADETGHV